MQREFDWGDTKRQHHRRLSNARRLLQVSARSTRDSALDRVAANSNPYPERALSEIAKLRGEYTGEEIRLRLESSIGRPHHHNAWGAIINQAVRRGLLRKTGEYRQMSTIKSHARATPVYVAGETTA